MNIINYNYKGSEISFEKGKNVMVNATQMAKPFNKRPAEYLRLPSTNELISAITRKYGIAHNQLVNTIRGGLNPGTWLHEDIALDTDDNLLKRSGELQDTIIEAAMQAAFWSDMLGLDSEDYLSLIDETLASKQAIWMIVNNNR